MLRTFTIITTNANADMAGLHDRVPVIVDQADWPAWLGEADGDRTALLRPSPDGTHLQRSCRSTAPATRPGQYASAGGGCQLVPVCAQIGYV